MFGIKEEGTAENAAEETFSEENPQASHQVSNNRTKRGFGRPSNMSLNSKDMMSTKTDFMNLNILDYRIAVEESKFLK